MQVAEEEMEHKFADITNKNTANNTFQQKMQGEIKTLTSDIEKESKNNLQLAHKIEENTKEVAKVATLEKAVSRLDKVVLQHITTVCNLETEVAKKINSECNDTPATDTNSIKKKITEIEEILQGSDKLGKEFKHLDDRVTQLRNKSYCNTYLLQSIYSQDMKTPLMKRHWLEICRKHHNHWREAQFYFDPEVRFIEKVSLL